MQQTGKTNSPDPSAMSTSGRTMRPQLTARQQEMLDYIERETSSTGVPPSIRQIGAALGIRSTNGVRLHLQALQKKGYIRRSQRTSRGIVSLDRLPHAASPFRSSAIDVPILGHVTAGTPIMAVENHEGSLTLDANLIKDQESFALRVNGDSMIDAGILDGDIVVVRSQQGADNGDIVVALLGEEVTVKRFYREEDKIRLQPENPAMAPIYSTDVEICGKVIALVRPHIF